MNSENSKTFHPHRLLLNITDKIDLRRDEKALLYQILVFAILGKTLKNYTTTINLKYHLQHEMINLNYLMDHILYQIFNTILNIFQKNMEKRMIILQ